MIVREKHTLLFKKLPKNSENSTKLFKVIIIILINMKLNILFLL